MNDVRFDRHARHRMKWRKITEEEVRSVLAQPDKTETTEKGRLNAYKNVGGRYIKVTFKKVIDHILIITAVDKSS